MRSEREHVWNGGDVGSGYDCTVVAHNGDLWVYLDAVGRDDAWLCVMDDDDRDLARLAVEVGSQGPGWFDGNEWDRESDEWEMRMAMFRTAERAAAECDCDEGPETTMYVLIPTLTGTFLRAIDADDREPDGTYAHRSWDEWVEYLQVYATREEAQAILDGWKSDDREARNRSAQRDIHRNF